MKKIFNLSAIILIFSFVYMPLFGDNFTGMPLISSISFFSWSIFSGNRNVINMPTIPSITDDDINLNKNERTDNYVSSLIDVWRNTSFNKDDFEKIKKTNDGKAMSVEEMAKLAEVSGISSDIKQSLEIWQQFDRKISDNLKNMLISQSNANEHKLMVAWYEYHANYAKKLTDDNLSKDKIRKINDNYYKNVKYYLPRIQKHLAADLDNRPLWARALINNVMAISSLYDFGSLVVWTQPCDLGFLFYGFGEKGGIFGIYYAVYAINPYLYRNIASSTYVLGRSVVAQFTCTDVGVPTGVAPFTVVFFGTSPF